MVMLATNRISASRKAQQPDFMLMIATMFKYIQFHPKKPKFQNNPNKVKEWRNGLIKSWDSCAPGSRKIQRFVQKSSIHENA
jgi:hypothetical protein